MYCVFIGDDDNIRPNKPRPTGAATFTSTPPHNLPQSTFTSTPPNNLDGAINNDDGSLSNMLNNNEETNNPEGEDDVTYEEGQYQGDDEWGEFFGLGQGCKTLIVDYKSAPRLGIYIPNGTVS